MRDTLTRYKPFLLFLGKFFFTYLILTLLYQYFLSTHRPAETDLATEAVGHQAAWATRLFNPEVEVIPHPESPFLKFYYSGQYVARIVEGCNAISVMILFTAFVVAFAGPLKTTFLFVVAGWMIIHILNIIRIALLAAAIFHYPEHEHFLHGVVFPLFIYGVVFLLWVVWVNKFSVNAGRK